MIKVTRAGVTLKGSIEELFTQWCMISNEIAIKFVGERMPVEKLQKYFTRAVRLAGITYGLLLSEEVDIDEEVEEDTLEDIIADFEATIMDTRMRLEVCNCSDNEIEAAFTQMDERIMQAHNKQMTHIMEALKKLEEEA